jgi:heme/copper-type cytochrome/quinol oxidase subunit 2
MQRDSLILDTLNNRPLPKWLTDRKTGITTIQSKKIELKEDKSLTISFTVTVAFIFLVVLILSLYFLKKHNKKPL